jgi:hypothetical protein
MRRKEPARWQHLVGWELGVEAARSGVHPVGPVLSRARSVAPDLEFGTAKGLFRVWNLAVPSGSTAKSDWGVRCKMQRAIHEMRRETGVEGGEWEWEWEGDGRRGGTCRLAHPRQRSAWVHAGTGSTAGRQARGGQQGRGRIKSRSGLIANLSNLFRPFSPDTTPNLACAPGQPQLAQLALIRPTTAASWAD